MDDKMMHIPCHNKPSLQIKVTSEKIQPLLNYTNQSKFNKIPKVVFLTALFHLFSLRKREYL